MVDDQFATSPSPAKTALVCVALLCGLAALVLLARADRAAARTGRRAGRRPRRRRSPPLVRALGLLVDAGVALLLVAWAFLTPMTGDDGYYAAMAKNSPVEGYVGNYYQLLNQSFTPFTWFYRVLGWWVQEVGDSPLGLRIPALAGGLVTYGLAVAVVAAGVPALARSGGPDRAACVRAVLTRTALAVVFLAWWLPQDMGVRPEAMVALAGMATAAAVLRALGRQSLLWAGVAVLTATVGLVCHPTGFVALAPLLAALPRLERLVSDRHPLSTAARTLRVLAPGAIAGVVAFGDGTLRDFTRGQQIFLAAQDQEGWTDKYKRYTFLLQDDFMGAYAKRLPVLVALLALALALWLLLAAALKGRGRPVPYLIHFSAVTVLLSFALLWLTPSKWTFHFGSLAGVGAVFLALFLVCAPPLSSATARDRGISPWALGAAGIAVVLAVALSFDGPNSWPSSWMLGVPQADEAPFLSVLRFSSPAVWAAGTLLVLGLLAVWHRRSTGRRTGVLAAVLPRALSLVLVTALALSAGYLLATFTVATARTWHTWSPWAETVQDPTASGCHAAGAFRVLDDAGSQPLTEVPGRARRASRRRRSRPAPAGTRPYLPHRPPGGCGAACNRRRWSVPRGRPSRRGSGCPR